MIKPYSATYQMIGNFIRNMNLESDIQNTSILKFYIKYSKNLKPFSHFCKNLQGNFFFNDQHQISTMNCSHLYQSPLLGIFLNSYPVKAHCEPLSESRCNRRTYSSKKEGTQKNAFEVLQRFSPTVGSDSWLPKR